MAAEKAKVYPKGTLPPAVRKQREPKFVPYEPYKVGSFQLGLSLIYVTGCRLVLGERQFSKASTIWSRGRLWKS